MICLDTNYLILGLVASSQESQDIINWTIAGSHWSRRCLLGMNSSAVQSLRHRFRL
jgi:hypothetical protein